MLVYATETDYITWTGDAETPANITRLIRAGSVIVRKATRMAVYDVTPSGAPSDDDIAEGFRDAVCAQAEWWTLAGIDPDQDSANITDPVTAKAIGSASISYGNTAPSKADATKTLCDTAIDILTGLGLSTQPVVL